MAVRSGRQWIRGAIGRQPAGPARRRYVVKPELLIIRDPHPIEREIVERVCTVHVHPDPRERLAWLARHGARIRAVFTAGKEGCSNAEMAAMPNLGIVCFAGAGHEGIDLAEAKRRGVVVTNTQDANSTSVADHAMALMLAVVRQVPFQDRMVRGGAWRTLDVLPGLLTGKRLGILGLGAIGTRVARRAAGFDMKIAYHNRHARPDVNYPRMESLLALADWCDVLLLSAPGGPATRHIVDEAVLKALGPEGFLVNVGRSSLVDTALLVRALREGMIAGAAVDVYDDEPRIPGEYLGLRNVVLTPHLGSYSAESLRSKTEIVARNLEAFFAGQPVLTPVTH